MSIEDCLVLNAGVAVEIKVRSATKHGDFRGCQEMSGDVNLLLTEYVFMCIKIVLTWYHNVSYSIHNMYSHGII